MELERVLCEMGGERGRGEGPEAYCQCIPSITLRNDLGLCAKIPFMSGNDSTAVPVPSAISPARYCSRDPPVPVVEEDQGGSPSTTSSTMTPGTVYPSFCNIGAEDRMGAAPIE